MPLQKQVIDVPLAENIDTHSDPKQAINPSALENAIITRAGEVAKRPGFQAVTVTTPTAVILPVCHGIFEYNNKPVLIVEGRGDGTGSNAAPTSLFYSPLEAGTFWIPTGDAGLAFNLSVDTFMGDRVRTLDTAHAVAYSGNYAAVMYVTGEVTSTCQLEIWDHVSRVCLHRVQFSDWGMPLRLNFIDDPTSGKILFATTQAGGTSQIRVITWRTATPTTAPAAETNLALTNAESPTFFGFDTCELYNVAAGKVDLVVAFVDSTNRLNIQAITGANTSRWLNTYATGTYNAPFENVCVFAVRAASFAEYRVIAAYDAIPAGTTNIYTVCVSASGSSLTAAPNLVNVSTYGGNNFEQLSGAGSFVGTGGQTYSDSTTESNIVLTARPELEEFTRLIFLDRLGARTGSERTLYNTQVVCGAFEYKCRNYLICTFYSSVTTEYGNEYYLVECSRGAATAPQIVGRFNVGTTYHLNNTPQLPKAYLKSDGVIACPMTRLSDLLADASGLGSEAGAWSMAIFLFNLGTPRVQIAASQRDRIVAAGRVFLYAGYGQELGFDWYPVIASPTTPAGGTSLGAGVYSIKATYEWYDQHGQRHRSAPSSGSSVTTAAGDDVLAPVTSLGNADSRKAARTLIAVHRTLVNGSVHKFDAQGVAAGETYIANDTLSQVLNLTSSESDANIDDNEILYTEGGEVDNIAPPASNIIMSHKNRVYLVPGEDRTAVWFSKERLAGIGLSFSDLLVLRCAEGGDIVALGSIDDYRIICKANSLYAFAGPGPNAQGFGAFTDIQRISADIGVRDPNSVVSFSGGMLFKSARGFYLLDRSMQTSFVGVGLDNISGLTAAECISAVHVPEKSRIYFIHADIRTIAVFDYLHKAWTTFELPSATFGTNFAGGVNISGVLYLAEADGTLWKLDESSGIYDESPSGYTFAVTTPWIRTAGVQGFQRVWWAHLTGVFPTSGTVTVKIYYDDNASTVVQTVTQTLSASTGSELRIKPSRQKCSSIRMRIEYAGTADFKLSKASLVCGVKGGKLNRLKAAATK